MQSRKQFRMTMMDVTKKSKKFQYGFSEQELIDTLQFYRKKFIY